jgi:hypothetical protein
MPNVCVQVSISTKKGVNLRSLTPADFLFSRKCYWLTSIEHPGVWWVDTRPDNAGEVKAFKQRAQNSWHDYVWPQFLTHEDAFDCWVDSWTRKCETDTVGTRGKAGAAFPTSDGEVLRSIIDFVQGGVHAHTHMHAHAHAHTHTLAHTHTPDHLII